MPPEPDASVRPVVAPMLPETAIVAALVREIAPADVRGPETVRLATPLSSRVKPPEPAVKLPTVPMAAPERVKVPEPPVRVAAVRTLPASLVMAPPVLVSSSRLVVPTPNAPPTEIEPACAVSPEPGIVTAPMRTTLLPIPVSDTRLPPAPNTKVVPDVFGATSVMPPVTVPPATMVNVSAWKLASPAAPAPTLPVAPMAIRPVALESAR